MFVRKMKIYHYTIVFLFILFSCTDTNMFSDKSDNETTNNTDVSDFSQNEDSLSVRKKAKNWLSWFKSEKHGHPYITNYKLGEAFDNQNWAIIQDSSNVMLFANRRGILTFDGEEWDVINTPGFPFALQKDPFTQRIYVGCYEDFGYLEKDNRGNYSYKSLSHGLFNLDEVISIKITKEYVYFYSHKSICRVNKKNYYEVDQLANKSNNFYAGVVDINGETFINIPEKGLINFDKLASIKGKNFSKAQTDTITNENISELKVEYTENENDYIKYFDDTHDFTNGIVIFSIEFDENNVLVGTTDNQLFLFNGHELTPYSIESNDFIENGVLFGGIEISEQEFALTTLNSGCMVIEKSTGKTISKVNYQTGLPDDEIFAVGIDTNKGLWLSHEFGLSRVNYAMPIKNYGAYPGLIGNIIAVADLKDTVYVATTEGLFFLGMVKDYKEVDTMVNVKKRYFVNVPVRKNNTGVKEELKQPQHIEENESDNNNPKEKKSWFNRWKNKILKKKKNKKDDDKEEEQKSTPVKQKEIEQSEIKQKKKTERKAVYRTKAVTKKKYEVESIWLGFSKIKGLREKCKQLIKLDDRLLVATNTGIYELYDKKVSRIFRGRYINHISKNNGEDKYYVGTNSGIFSIIFDKGMWHVKNDFEEFNKPVYSIAQNGRILWLGSENIAYMLELDAFGKAAKLSPKYFENDFSERIILREFNRQVYFFLASGTYMYDEKNDKIIAVKGLGDKKKTQNLKYVFSQNAIIWIHNQKEWHYMSNVYSIESDMLKYINLFDDVQYLYIDDRFNLWLVNGKNGLYNILDKETMQLSDYAFDVMFKQITNNTGQNFSLDEIEIDYQEYEDNPLSFKIIAPFYIKQDQVTYQWFIDGLSKKWSNLNKSNIIEVGYIPSGQYLLNVRAKNALGYNSEIKSFPFTIRPPFWESHWFRVLMAVVFLLIVYLFIKIREKNHAREKRILEEKVKERTLEIEKKNEQIHDSILYAKRIQEAILPYEDIMSNKKIRPFVFYRPKDVVSGDYYWFSEKNGKLIFVAADCTGHGVPGAFLSMLGVTILHEIINTRGILQANEVLNEVRKNVINALHQKGKKGEAQDGMDIALCVYDPATKQMQYAGANNPCVIIREGDLIELKPDKMPASIYGKKSDIPFTNNHIDLQKDDIIYIYSDGYIDQFGGPNDRKFLSKQFKKMLLDISNQDMESQLHTVEQRFDNWKGKKAQLDDVLVIGVKIL